MGTQLKLNIKNSEKKVRILSLISEFWEKSQNSYTPPKKNLFYKFFFFFSVALILFGSSRALFDLRSQRIRTQCPV